MQSLDCHKQKQTGRATAKNMDTGNEKISQSNAEIREPSNSSATEIETPPTWGDVESYEEHAAHPIRYCCETCQQVIRDLERAAYILKFQPIFTFFADWQLLEMEEYLTGEDRDTMLPRPTAAADARHGNQATRRKIYLKAEHLTTTPKAAKILSAQSDENAKFGPSVEVKVSMDGKTFFWTLNVNRNPNYGLLTDKLGFDETAWKGQAIFLGLELDEHDEIEFPRVTFPKK